MCGITGYIDFNKQSSEEILNSMTSTLNYRGPDGAGTELISENNFQLGLGSKVSQILLSLVSLSLVFSPLS